MRIKAKRIGIDLHLGFPNTEENLYAHKTNQEAGK
jgi:hypothetical protein